MYKQKNLHYLLEKEISRRNSYAVCNPILASSDRLPVQRSEYKNRIKISTDFLQPLLSLTGWQLNPSQSKENLDEMKNSGIEVD